MISLTTLGKNKIENCNNSNNNNKKRRTPEKLKVFINQGGKQSFISKRKATNLAECQEIFNKGIFGVFCLLFIKII